MMIRKTVFKMMIWKTVFKMMIRKTVFKMMIRTIKLAMIDCDCRQRYHDGRDENDDTLDGYEMTIM